MRITPHVVQNTTNQASALDRRTARHAGYALSQEKRKRVGQTFGWATMIGMFRKVKLRGGERVGWLFAFTAAPYNLMRLQRPQAKAVARTARGQGSPPRPNAVHRGYRQSSRTDRLSLT